jgi:hypothetical protein
LFATAQATGIPLTSPRRSAIFPWESKHGKKHFYVEYADAASVNRARLADIRGFACFIVSKDKQHRTRFASLSSRTFANAASGLALKPTRGTIRYSPYTIPGGSYTTGDYASSSQAPARGKPSTSSDLLPTPSPLFLSPAPLYNGHNNAEMSSSSEEGMSLTEHSGSRIAAADASHVSASFPPTSSHPSSKVYHAPAVPLLSLV